MGRRTRECLLCGTKYEYCPSCSQDKMKPTWMAEFHNENCKNIFDICTRFNIKLIDKFEAKTALSNCDLSGKKSFKSYVQRDLENIFAEEPKPRRSKRAELPIIDESMPEAPKVEVIDEIIHEVVKTEE